MTYGGQELCRNLLLMPLHDNPRTTWVHSAILYHLGQCWIIPDVLPAGIGDHTSDIHCNSDHVAFLKIYKGRFYRKRLSFISNLLSEGLSGYRIRDSVGALCCIFLFVSWFARFFWPVGRFHICNFRCVWFCYVATWVHIPLIRTFGLFHSVLWPFLAPFIAYKVLLSSVLLFWSNSTALWPGRSFNMTERMTAFKSVFCCRWSVRISDWLGTEVISLYNFLSQMIRLHVQHMTLSYSSTVSCNKMDVRMIEIWSKKAKGVFADGSQPVCPQKWEHTMRRLLIEQYSRC